ncbi:hypothetical protein GF326_00650 [Candidatus Bathyarchaeota archaeon]|nr:hypothetical protein [Candidatus Bathyarchaeota archaeon]
MTEINSGLKLSHSKEAQQKTPLGGTPGKAPRTALLSKRRQETAPFRKHSNQNRHLFTPKRA